MLFATIYLILLNQRYSHGVTIEMQANAGKCLIVGDTLELNCSINNWNEIHEPDIQQLRITHSNRRTSAPISTSIVDNRTIQAVLTNIGIGESGRYECCYKPDCELARSLIFDVAEHDPFPEHVDCIANGKETEVNCTWTSQDKCTTWSLFFNSKSDEIQCVLPQQEIPERCAGQSIDSNTYTRTRCRIPFEGGQMKMQCHMNINQHTYTLRLERMSSYGESTPITEKWFLHNNVKIDPLQNLNVNRTSTTMSLGWKFQRPLSWYYPTDIICLATCGDNHRLQVFQSDVNGNIYEVTGTVFEGLRPYTEYNISVKCKVNGSSSWGEAIERSFMTEEDVPLTGPNTTNQSYTLTRCRVAIPDTCLTIHTKHVDTINANGRICGYEIEIRSNTMPNVSRWFNYSNTPTTLEIGPLDNGIFPPFNVSIWSKTSKGLSKGSTDIFINLSKGEVIIEEVIVEEGETYYIVSTRTSGASPSNYVFHWCYGISDDVDTVMCKDGYGYQESTKQEVMIEKQELGWSIGSAEYATSDRWHFGVSVSPDTSGIHWEDCLFVSDNHVRSPSQPKKPLLSDGINDKIVVDVQSFCRSAASGELSLRPMNYTIVCVNNEGHPDTQTKSFEAHYKYDRFEIDNLKTGTTYNVKYNIGYRQTTSLYSESVSKYVSSKPKIKLIVGVTVGTTVALLVIITIIAKFFIWYNNIEHPIEGVEIRNSNEKMFNSSFSNFDESGIGSQRSDDVIDYVVTNIPNGTFRSSELPEQTTTSNDTRVIYHNSDKFNPTYSQIGLSSSENCDCPERSEPRSDNAPNRTEASSKEITTVEDSSGVKVDGSKSGSCTTMVSDGAHNITLAVNEKQSLAGADTEETPVLTGYMPMNRPNPILSDAKYDDGDTSTILRMTYFSMSGQQGDDYLPMHLDVSCLEKQS